jgi:dimethylhistidine N-methyltransferase
MNTDAPALDPELKADERASFADDVRIGMAQSQRWLPTRFLYDALGSALFDAICRLPWYPITASELGLLTRRGAEIFRRSSPSRIVELGSGNGEKLSVLLSAAPRRTTLDVHVVDLSTAALAQAARLLGGLDRVQVHTHVANYEDGMSSISREMSRPGPTLVLYLGSNIGNYEPHKAAALLTSIRAAMRPGDSLLLGTDLVKPLETLLRAYDDPLGVTAAFNRNLLVRVNRELDGNFDLDAFSHRAVWNAELSRIEMHLVSNRRQHVRIAAAGVEITLEDGETIWTESSYKYTAAKVDDARGTAAADDLRATTR